MRATVGELTERAASLPTDQRLTLASRILATIEPPPTAAIEEAWDREIRDRITKFKKVFPDRSLPRKFLLNSILFSRREAGVFRRGSGRIA